MNNHQTRIAGGDGAWQAKCSCSLRSPVFDHRWEAEDWNLTHGRAVDRARVHLYGHPSLKDQRDWYRKQAALTNDKETEAMWLMLAEEIDHRLGPTSPNDEPLW